MDYRMQMVAREVRGHAADLIMLQVLLHHASAVVVVVAVDVVTAGGAGGGGFVRRFSSQYLV